ncbi:MAG: CDP-alcohol phosphatidyltransferase family protein, partial [Myxococcota bacterium]
MPDSLIPALWPVVVILAYFALAAVALGIRTAVYGRFRDEETLARGSSVVLPMGLRLFLAWSLMPIWRFFRWTQIPATAVTTLATLVGFASGLALAKGHLALGGWLYLASGIGDVLDGRLARHHGTAGPQGAAIDSVLDRYSDAAVLMGLAYYLRDSWTMVLAMLAMVGSLLVSYVRARGEGLGVDVKVGLMQRPERVVILGVTFVLAPVAEWATAGAMSAIQVIVAVVGFVAVMTHITALRRLSHTLRALGPQAGQTDAADFSRLAPAMISAALATGADFMSVNALVEEAHFSASLATGIGCIVGGCINFCINRWWTFDSAGRMAPQALRYTAVSATS